MKTIIVTIILTTSLMAQAGHYTTVNVVNEDIQKQALNLVDKGIVRCLSESKTSCEFVFESETLRKLIKDMINLRAFHFPLSIKKEKIIVDTSSGIRCVALLKTLQTQEGFSEYDSKTKKLKPRWSIYDSQIHEICAGQLVTHDLEWDNDGEAVTGNSLYKKLMSEKTAKAVLDFKEKLEKLNRQFYFKVISDFPVDTITKEKTCSKGYFGSCDHTFGTVRLPYRIQIGIYTDSKF